MKIEAAGAGSLFVLATKVNASNNGECGLKFEQETIEDGLGSLLLRGGLLDGNADGPLHLVDVDLI